MFDASGTLIRQLTVPSRHSQCTAAAPTGAAVRPYGLCVLNELTRRPDAAGTGAGSGLIAVCDRDGHRVALISYDGADAGDLLTSHDGLRYPYDVAVAVTEAGVKLVAVVESSSGLPGTSEQHHAVKLFTV